ncbi:PF07601 family protein [Leptospira interrogans str. HAI1594]|nr:PF07601 family protein [Leptospira interrogans str. HAI1594]
MLKNSLVPINKTALIARFHKIETDGELIFQQFYFIEISRTNR